MGQRGRNGSARLPHVTVSPAAIAGIVRCRKFLAGRSPAAAERASAVIDVQLTRLETMPEAGRPYRNDTLLRELVIEFGDSGYLALYRYDRTSDAVVVLAFRHQKEVGY